MPITGDAQYKGCPTTTRPVRRPQWNGKRVSSAPFQSTCLLASADQYRCLLSARNIHTLSPLAGLIEYRLRRTNINGRLRVLRTLLSIPITVPRLLAPTTTTPSFLHFPMHNDNAPHFPIIYQFLPRFISTSTQKKIFKSAPSLHSLLNSTRNQFELKPFELKPLVSHRLSFFFL